MSNKDNYRNPHSKKERVVIETHTTIRRVDDSTFTPGFVVFLLVCLILGLMFGGRC